MTMQSRSQPYLLAAWISACASPVELPEPAGTVRDLYRQALSSDAPAPMPRPLPAGEAEDHPLAREVDRQLRHDFRMLPNPRLVLYVYPHLAADGAPVPGYASWFHVFERGPVLEVAR